jgi:uncharacterized protein
MKDEIFTRIKEIAKRIKKDYNAKKVILYGSYARGEETEDSDIDLFVIADTNEAFLTRMTRVRGLIRNLRKGLGVSPLVLTQGEVEDRIKIGDQFIIGIIEEGVLL